MSPRNRYVDSHSQVASSTIFAAVRCSSSLERFRFGPSELEHLTAAKIVDEATCEWLSTYRFRGDIDGYAEGDVYFPGSPILTVDGTFGDAVLLETLALSILNHDSAVASAASRMVCAAGQRPLIEMGSRRTHEEAAATAASSCVRRLPIPTSGRCPAAQTIREAAEATAESWLRMLSASVSSSTASPNVPSTVKMGEPGK